MEQKGNVLIFLLVGIFVIAAIGGAFYLGRQTTLKYSPAPLATSQTPQPTITAQSTSAADETANWKIYRNNKFNIRLRYPLNWSEPETQEHEDGFNLVTGTNSNKNSYYITFQYSKRPNAIPIERYKSIQEAVQRELKLSEQSEGESIVSAIYTLTKVKDIQIQNFSGVEFISSIPETAHTNVGSVTDWKFNNVVRKALLVNDNHDIMSIVGSPNNLDLTDGIDKKIASQRIDEDYLNEFHGFVNSVKFTQ